MSDYKLKLQQRIKDLTHRIVLAESNQKEYDRLSTIIKDGNLLHTQVEAEQHQLQSTSNFLSKYRIDKRVMDSNQITNTTTSIVNFVFPEYDYTYFLDGKISGDYTHTQLLFRDSSGFTYVPAISNGNGVQQIASLSCTMVVTALSDITPSMILDERLRSISPDKAKLMGEILHQFTAYGFQFLIIEHTEELFERIDYTEVNLVNDNRETKLLNIRQVINREESMTDD